MNWFLQGNKVNKGAEGMLCLELDLGTEGDDGGGDVRAEERPRGAHGVPEQQHPGGRPRIREIRAGEVRLGGIKKAIVGTTIIKPQNADEWGTLIPPRFGPRLSMNMDLFIITTKTLEIPR